MDFSVFIASFSVSIAASLYVRIFDSLQELSAHEWSKCWWWLYSFLPSPKLLLLDNSIVVDTHPRHLQFDDFFHFSIHPFTLLHWLLTNHTLGAHQPCANSNSLITISPYCHFRRSAASSTSTHRSPQLLESTDLHTLTPHLARESGTTRQALQVPSHIRSKNTFSIFGHWLNAWAMVA